MAPPAATFEASPASFGHDLSVKKIAMANAATNDRQFDVKKLAGVETADWESFTFAPIRESQVSRAMSRFALRFDSLHTYNIPSASLFR